MDIIWVKYGCYQRVKIKLLISSTFFKVTSLLMYLQKKIFFHVI